MQTPAQTQPHASATAQLEPSVRPHPAWVPPAKEELVPPIPSPDLTQLTAMITELRNKHLTLPVQGLKPEALRDTFGEARSSGRTHEAIDILAARNTPVLAAEDGRIAKLWLSVPGGITLYQFDPTEKYAYYYAHLENYAPNLKEGQWLHRGDVIGYVGTSGNAPKDTPHLHFAIYRLTAEKKWSKGTPINPFLILK